MGGTIIINNITTDKVSSINCYCYSLLVQEKSYGNIKIANCTNNINLENYNMSIFVGMYAGSNGTTCNIAIINCYNYGSIDGSNNSCFIGCYSSTNESNADIQSICNVTINYCYNYGNINGYGNSCFIGRYQEGYQEGYDDNCALNNVNINDCYNNGSINGSNNACFIGIYAGSYNNDNIYNLSINNCYNSGTIDGIDNACFIGCNSGNSNGDLFANIINCYNNNTIVGYNNACFIGNNCSKDRAGGRFYNVDFINCYNNGIIDGSNNACFIGCNANSSDGHLFANIINCYNNSIITGNRNACFIGCNSLDARDYGTGNINIINCYNNSIINGSNNACFIGCNCGSNSIFDSYTDNAPYNANIIILNCYNSGTVDGIDNACFIGNNCGIGCGIVYTNIINCYNSGSIDGSNNACFIGNNCGINNGKVRTNIINCYNTGTINDNNNYSFIGNDSIVSGIISNCYDISSTNFSPNNIIDISNCIHDDGTWNTPTGVINGVVNGLVNEMNLLNNIIVLNNPNFTWQINSIQIYNIYKDIAKFYKYMSPMTIYPYDNIIWIEKITPWLLESFNYSEYELGNEQTNNPEYYLSKLSDISMITVSYMSADISYNIIEIIDSNNIITIGDFFDSNKSYDISSFEFDINWYLVIAYDDELYLRYSINLLSITKYIDLPRGVLFRALWVKSTNYNGLQLSINRGKYESASNHTIQDVILSNSNIKQLIYTNNNNNDKIINL